MSLFRVILSFLLPLVVLQMTYAQSGWVLNKGEVFAKADLSHSSSKRFFNSDGNELETNSFRQNAINLYVEYGLTPSLTLIASVPALRANQFSTTEPVFGIGDLRLEAKWGVLKGKTPIAISVAPEIPTGRANARAQHKTIDFEQINLPLGDGEFNVWTTIAASRSFGAAYLSIYAAYDFRTAYEGDSFRDLYAFGGEVGLALNEATHINFKLRSQLSTGPSESPNLSFIRGDASTFTQVSLEGHRSINKRWGISLQAAHLNGVLTPARNVYAAPTFSIGLTFQTKKDE